MDKVIIIRYGELHLKGKNRGFFENLLVNTIKKSIKDIDCIFVKGRGRYFVTDFSALDETNIVKKLSKIAGIHSISLAHKAASTYEALSSLAIKLSKQTGTFRVNCNRADKTFPMGSLELARTIGKDILDSNPNLEVDLHSPSFIINIDIREDGFSYIFSDATEGLGGLPVGSSGKGLLLLSGGIDSPVAGFLMSKRGMSLDAIHFHSYPYTSEQAKQKVIDLAKILTDYCGQINLIVVPFTAIQEAIHNNVNSNYMITIVRRFMMEISEKIALKRNCQCLINGESLGQVASQTIQSITVTNAKVKEMPVFRPLIGMDKNEIIDISVKIGTFDTSILPYEDCCTVFLPDSPVIKPTIEKAENEESKILNASFLVDDAINNLEIFKII